MQPTTVNDHMLEPIFEESSTVSPEKNETAKKMTILPPSEISNLL
jgi:hypothetical protein